MEAEHSADARSIDIVVIDIVTEINCLYDAVDGKLRLTNAIRIGELLTEQKEKLPHGGWLAWIKANLDFGQQKASRYMACFNNRHRLDDPNYALRRNLSIKDLARDEPATREANNEPECEAETSEPEPNSQSPVVDYDEDEIIDANQLTMGNVLEDAVKQNGTLTKGKSADPIKVTITRMWRTYNGKKVTIDLFRQFGAEAKEIPGRAELVKKAFAEFKG